MPRLDLDLRVLQTKTEFDVLEPQLADRRIYESALSARHARDEAWTDFAFCEACDQPREMQSSWTASYADTINFREHLMCRTCGLNARLRFIAGRLREAASLDSSILVVEDGTAFARWAAGALTGEVLVDGIEDSNPESVDVIAANDVMQDLSDFDGVLKQCVGALREGGWLYFTMPFDPNGDWEILDRCRSAGFVDAFALGYWSTLYGYLGLGLQIAFAARAPVALERGGA